MNKRAKTLWLKNTFFKNPTWLDEKWQVSTAYDLAILSQFILKNKFIQKIVKTQKTNIFSKNTWRKIEIKTTNYLLSHKNIFWLKTWTTKKAGQCLITLIKKDWKNFLFILLGSENRFQETRKLIDFIFSKI
jgi:D-alanyl-D-alanine carboxypeptidase (penicillin-binding protein 5/6)